MKLLQYFAESQYPQLESRKEGFSARKFAELIKRHPSTIYRELKRNSINDVYQAR
ncbi:helix-turn-helix domain-containing protein, partial [Acinetobacter pittii]